MQIICHLGWIFNRPLHAGSALVKRAEDRGLVFVEKMRSEQSQWTLAGDGRWGGRPSREAGVVGCGLPAPACGHSALSVAAPSSTALPGHTSVLTGHHPSFRGVTHLSSTPSVTRRRAFTPKGARRLLDDCTCVDEFIITFNVLNVMPPNSKRQEKKNK